MGMRGIALIRKFVLYLRGNNKDVDYSILEFNFISTILIKGFLI